MLTKPFNGRLIPSRRTAIDGRTWWCVYDLKSREYSGITYFGKYKTRRACEYAIQRLWETVRDGRLYFPY